MSEQPGNSNSGEPSDFLRKKAWKREQERLSHIRPSVQALVARGTEITMAEWAEVSKDGLNSYEREHIIPLLETEMLCIMAKQMIANCAPKRDSGPCSTYDEAVIHMFMPLLIERLGY